MAEPERNKKLGSADLTRGEKLYLNRKRRGMTQVEMSVDLGVSFGEYRAMEVDGEGVKPPYTALGRLGDLEVFVVLRRRNGWSRAHLAQRIGISAEWVRQMEVGTTAPKKLWEFWGSLCL